MLKYRGRDGDNFRVEDTDDGTIESVDGKLLRDAFFSMGIEGCFVSDDGDIVDEFGFVLVKAPPMPGRNSNLSKAKKEKNDEFYTQLADIEKELSHYPVEAFKDKVIYCPMDVAVNTGATMQSQFVKYFQMNAHRLQFKKLICTCLVERAAAEGESLEQVQNCYVLERVTVPADQRHIYGYTHGYGRTNGVVGETVDEVGRIMYDTQDGHSHKVPYHIINQAVTEANGRIVLVKKYIDHYDEVDGHPVLGDEYTGRGWVFEGHQLTIKWCRKHPDGTIEMLPDECYFFNNGDFLSDFSIFPKDEGGNPCFESVDGGSVCLYPSEYYDYREVEYEEYSSHCPADSQWGSGDFRSEYCKKLLAECDIVVTNPPFSLFREWWDLIIHSGKRFIFIGNINCVTYKEVFPYIKSGELKVGFNAAGGTRKGNSMYYWSPLDGKLRDIQSWWFHNIPGIKESGKHDKSEYLPMAEWTRKGVEYPKYDNYDAIDVSAEQKIPIDYEGVMGISPTALRYLDVELFEILGMCENEDLYGLKTKVYTSDEKRAAYFAKFGKPGQYDLNASGVLIVDGLYEKTYQRILIRRRSV